MSDKKELMKYIPKDYKPYVVNIFEGKKDFNPITGRIATLLCVEWENGVVSEFANKNWARTCIKETYMLDDVRKEN